MLAFLIKHGALDEIVKYGTYEAMTILFNFFTCIFGTIFTIDESVGICKTAFTADPLPERMHFVIRYNVYLFCRGQSFNRDGHFNSRRYTTAFG